MIEVVIAWCIATACHESRVPLNLPPIACQTGGASIAAQTWCVQNGCEVRRVTCGELRG